MRKMGGCPVFPSLLFLHFTLLLAGCAPEKERIILATTTSVEDTGLLDSLATSFAATHPQFVLAPVAAGTGMVLAIGRRKDADVLVTHDSAGEMKFVSDGYGYERRYIMQNDFVIVGPGEDPAGIRGQNVVAALRALSRAHQTFISRGDDSGTHRSEMRLWHLAGIQPAGDWYVEAGVGQADALLLAGQKHAYMMTDRATYVTLQQRVNLDVLVQDDPRLSNKYSVIVVRGARNEAGGQAFADWLVGPAARGVINTFGNSKYGGSLFQVR